MLHFLFSEEPLTYAEFARKEFATNFVHEQNRVIEKAFADAGYNLKDTVTVKRITVVRNIDDPFVHLYLDWNLPTERRIISVQEVPTLEMPYDDNAQLFKMTATAQYY